MERSSRPEFIAPSANGKAMDLPAGPVAVSGKLTAANEEQRFRVTVTPNTKVRFEVFAERIGSPIDAAFVIRNETGGVLAQAEDSPGTLDPVLEYAVPDKVTAVTVGVLDSSGKASPRGFYRLVVDPVKSGGSGDFYAFTPLGRLTIPAGGRVIVPVYIDRRGYQGKIAFTADSFLGGIKFEDTVIAPDADGTLVTVSNNGGNGLGLGEGYVLAVMHWKLSGEHGETRSIFVKGHPLEHIQPWLAGEISLSQTKQKAEDFTIDWRNLPPDAGLSPGGKLSLPFTVKRLDPAAPVRLVLLTSQSPPFTNNQPDPARALRGERPIELAAKTSDGDFPLLIPPGAPRQFVPGRTSSGVAHPGQAESAGDRGHNSADITRQTAGSVETRGSEFDRGEARCQDAGDGGSEGRSRAPVRLYRRHHGDACRSSARRRRPAAGHHQGGGIRVRLQAVAPAHDRADRGETEAVGIGCPRPQATDHTCQEPGH